MVHVLVKEGKFLYYIFSNQHVIKPTGDLTINYIQPEDSKLLSNYVIFGTKLSENSLKELRLERLTIIKDSSDLNTDILSFSSSFGDNHFLNETFHKLIQEPNDSKMIK
mmetsp:Transcript_25662/g.28489  ORF Transcript_25662/g.28489 Transcript_25662/m.28489 type:complete len:109 (-) Transcript_25662:18-344(-)